MTKISWDQFTKTVFSFPECELALDFSRMPQAIELMTSMRPALEKAFAEMEQLEGGAIANPDENRMVGHYWLRNPEKAPNEAIARDIRKTIDEILAFAQGVTTGTIHPKRDPRFEHVILVGIGGSALGPQLVADALWSASQRMKIWFCDNTDPDGIRRLVAQMGEALEKSIVLVISKSGATLETRNGALELAAAFEHRGLSFHEHAVAITCPGSKLEKQAHEEHWLNIFHLWDWVGGRTSLFSAVGLVPAALLGIDVNEFLAGAHEMDELTRTHSAEGNPAALLALAWFAAGNGRGEKDMVVLPYRDRLMLFSKYLQQLVMESLGKENDLDGKVVNQGIAVYGNKGSTDQHAYVQQLREGVNNFFATFIEVLTDYSPMAEDSAPVFVEPQMTSGDYLTGFMLGTRQALFENGRSSITLTIEKINARSLARLIALYERAVGFYASLVNINAYHQPGVEAGKKAAARVLDLQGKAVAFLSLPDQRGKDFDVVTLCAAIGEAGEEETVYKVLAHLAANPGRGVIRKGENTPALTRFAQG